MKPIIEVEHPFYDIPGPIAILHRGGDGAGSTRGNTMTAFDAASRAGFLYIETDVIATRDNVVVVFHGSKNKRSAKQSAMPQRDQIQAMTYAQIKRHISIGGEVIPTFEEVATVFPKMRFFVDPKTDEVVPLLAKLIQKHKLENRISVGSFNYRRTKSVAAAFPNGQEQLCTSLAKLGTVMMLGLGLGVTTQFVRPYFHGTLATSLQVPYQLVTRRMIVRAHELGIRLIVWPWKPERYDNRMYMDRALRQGVYGLMSDHAEELRQAILVRDPLNRSVRS